MNGYTLVRMRSDELIGEAERVRLAAGDPAASQHPGKTAGLRHAVAGWWRGQAGHGATRGSGRSRLAMAAGREADGRTR